MKAWIEIEKVIFSNLRMIFDIAKRDFKKEFAGSRFGLFWAIVKPLSMILVFTFVHTAFGAGPIMNVIPNILWLIVGYVPWVYMLDCISTASGSIRANSFLVKKVKFPVEILPSIRMVVNFYTFMILVGIGLVFFAIYGIIDPNVLPAISGFNIILFIYFLTAMIIFLSAIVRLLSSWIVMSIDVMHGVGVILNFLFWAMPIMWPYPLTGGPEILGLVDKISKLNPLTYLINGFRYSIFNAVGIQDLAPTLGYTIYFWAFTIILFIIASKTYKKLRPEFDDVL